MLFKLDTPRQKVVYFTKFYLVIDNIIITIKIIRLLFIGRLKTHFFNHHTIYCILFHSKLPRMPHKYKYSTRSADSASPRI